MQKSVKCKLQAKANFGVVDVQLFYATCLSYQGGGRNHQVYYNLLSKTKEQSSLHAAAGVAHVLELVGCNRFSQLIMWSDGGPHFKSCRWLSHWLIDVFHKARLAKEVIGIPHGQTPR